jgi:hypothetical protein
MRRSHNTQAQSTASHSRLTSSKDGHTVHKLSQRRLTADSLAPKTVTQYASSVNGDSLPTD